MTKKQQVRMRLKRIDKKDKTSDAFNEERTNYFKENSKIVQLSINHSTLKR